MSLQKRYQLTITNGLIRAHLDADHELVRLSEKIDWESITERLGRYYSDVGRGGKPIRLMVGLHILKHLYNLSDEAVVARLNGDLYFWVLCGLDDVVGKREKPLDASSLTNFRKRIGVEGMGLIQEVILGQLISEKRINKRTQIVDSTVMEKNIQYPTDVRLLNKGRELLVRSLKRLKKSGARITTGRTFSRSARRLVILNGKFRNVDGKTRLDKTKRSLIKYGEEVLQNAKRAIKKLSRHRKKTILREKERLEQLMELFKRVIDQTKRGLKGQKTRGRVYSLSEPHVIAIGKGKLRARFEYGSLSTLSVDNNGFIVSHQQYDHNIADVSTLEPAVRAWEAATGVKPKELAGDRGYSTRKHPEYIQEIDHLGIPSLGARKGLNEDKAWFKRLRRRRVSAEAIISHLKNDHRFNRSRYKGFKGDQINAGWATLSWNCRKWVQAK